MDGAEEGIVIVTAEGPGVRQWQQSPDGGTTIIALNPTLGGTTIVTDLIPGEKVWFRSRTILSGNVYGEWTLWMPITPKVF